MQRIETLDLSLGTLSDEGARSLLGLRSPTLKKLNLHYHFVGPELVRQLQGLPFTVDASRPADMEEDEEFRFVAVGEIQGTRAERIRAIGALVGQAPVVEP